MWFSPSTCRSDSCWSLMVQNTPFTCLTLVRKTTALCLSLSSTAFVIMCLKFETLFMRPTFINWSMAASSLWPGFASILGHGRCWRRGSWMECSRDSIFGVVSSYLTRRIFCLHLQLRVSLEKRCSCDSSVPSDLIFHLFVHLGLLPCFFLTKPCVSRKLCQLHRHHLQSGRQSAVVSCVLSCTKTWISLWLIRQSNRNPCMPSPTKTCHKNWWSSSNSRVFSLEEAREDLHKSIRLVVSAPLTLDGSRQRHAPVLDPIDATQTKQ